MMHIEKHPLQPFLPAEATILMLGSFPPPHARWSMEFFYPNWINDMWRIVGLLFFNDKHHFEINDEKRFHKEKIASFCSTNGLALYDAASAVHRLQDNASDKFLEVITPTNLCALLSAIPHCAHIVTTGQKASEILSAQFDCPIPAVGEAVTLHFEGRTLRFWRMPSTSRAYPLALEKKAAFYRKLFAESGLLR